MRDGTRYIIGIDTGGTYTDAAIIDADKHAIVASAKALTTKGDLAEGVADAMAAAIAVCDRFEPAGVGMVSVSTTLATNAVVEGHGSAVGLILVGFDKGMVARSGLALSFPDMPILAIAGGHDHNGAEIKALDVEVVRRWVRENAGKVTAFAVAASFAVRNPAHEEAVREEIVGLCDKPVTISSELASALDAPRRAQTAVLNARLVSRIGDLVAAVRRAMAQHGLSCQLMLVKGDGSLIKSEIAARRPIETVLSGPAASLIGAQWLSGREDFIMSDMGGTTTDVGLLLAGRPQVADQGAEIGGWRTMVKAIDVKTIGLGGDSEVHVKPDGSVDLGPERAVPISLLAARQPGLIDMLAADLAETTGGSQLGKFLVLPFGSKGAVNSSALTTKEAEVLAQVSDRPIALRKVATGSAAGRAIAGLRRRGLIQYCALTPSDAAHVLKLQDNWSAQAAELAVKISAKFADMKLPDEGRMQSFALLVWVAAVQGGARAILDVAFGESAQGPLVDAVVQGVGMRGRVAVSLRPDLPIVAVGGPVRIYYPAIAKRLGCEVVFPPHCDVANAIGAAAGLVAYQAVVNVEGDGNGVFRVSGHGPVLTLSSANQALSKARELAEAAAFATATEQGALNVKVKLNVVKHHLPNAQNDDGLLSAIVIADARGAAVPIQN